MHGCATNGDKYTGGYTQSTTCIIPKLLFLNTGQLVSLQLITSMSVSDTDSRAILDVNPSHTLPIGYEPPFTVQDGADLQSAHNDESQSEVTSESEHTHAEVPEMNGKSNQEEKEDVQAQGTEGEEKILKPVTDSPTEIGVDLKDTEADLKDAEADLKDEEDSKDTETDLKEPGAETRDYISSRDVNSNDVNSILAESPDKPVLSTQASTESIPTLSEHASSESKPKKKRLTLQERLALAAKAKKKLQVLAPETETKDPETPVSVPGTPVPDVAESFNGEIQPETEPLADARPAQLEIQQLNSRIAALLEENTALKQSNILKQSQNRSQPDLTEWKRVVAERDTTIQQLMEEGQALSKKELKLNERVRSLVQDNTALESSLQSYAAKNEEVLFKLQEIEDVIRVHKLKSVEQLLEHLEDTRHKLAEAQANLSKEKSANWEGKYKELQALYEEELNLKRDALKQLNDSSLHLQMLENHTALALQSKDELIEQLNRQIIQVKDESSLEISRLEGKIENLRLENESFLKMSQGDRASEPEADSSSHKQIDYAEYSKLSSSHRDLQAQYVSSQENWKTIESNLQSKVLAMTSSLESFKKAKLKSIQEIRKLGNQLLEQTEVITGLENALSQSKTDNNELNLQLKIKKGEYTELEEKLEELRTVFNSDRQNYDLRIQSLSETIEKYEEQDSEVLAFQSASTENIVGIHSRRMNDSGLHINLGHPSIGRHFSYNSMSLMNTPAQNWDERGDFPDLNDSRHQIDPRMSSASIPEEYQTYDGPEGPDYSDTTKSGTPTLPSFSNGNNNIQLINKMSSSIRRLEMELLSIREENAELSRQKNEAQEEIVGKYELNHRVEELEKSIAELTEELGDKTKNEQTLLEVIGEKSERAAELQADVEDLKDLCRQQVQQMIEMAEKSV